MENSFTDLSRYRLDRAKDDLQSARILIENNKIPQSINRSYYAIFHATRALCTLDKFDSKKHSGIISHFNKNYIKTGIIDKEYSKILMAAQDYRNDSDYDDYFTVTEKEALEQIENAEKFINRIEKYISERT